MTVVGPGSAVVANDLRAVSEDYQGRDLEIGSGCAVVSPASLSP